MPLPGLFPPPFCTPTPAAEVVARAEAALQVFPAGEMARFYREAAEAQNLLACTSEPLSPAQAATWHQAMAVLLSVERDNDGAMASLRAALAADGSRSLPSAVTDAKPILLELETSARASTASGGIPVLAPEGRSVLVDGKAALTLPVDRPYILQVLWTSDGEVHWSGFVPVGEKTPDLAVIAPLPPPSCPVTSPVHGPSPVLVGGALGSSALALGLYVGAVATDQVFWDPATDAGRLDGLRTQAVTLQWSAIGVGVVALGLDGLLGVRTAYALKAGR